MSRKKGIAAAGVALLSVAGVALAVIAPVWGSGSAKDVQTEPVARGAIAARVTATGTLSPLVSVQVGSQVSGNIKEILVDWNSPVEKGQVLARMDARLFQSALEQADANVKAAEGNLAKSKAQAADADRQRARAKSLASQDLTPKADLDTAEATADAARAQVAASEGALSQAQAALHQAQVTLEYATISSPTKGIVISRNVDVGQTVAASLQAPTLFTIAEDLRKMQVDTSVAEADVGKVRPGMPAEFSVEAYPGETFTGKVRQVRNAPQVVQNVVTYDAVIDVENADGRLKPGMTANVTFVYAERSDVLRVPNAALRFRPPAGWKERPAAAGGSRPGEGAGGAARAPEKAGRDAAPAARTVWVLAEDGPRPVKVVPGISDGVYTEVAGGSLHAGDQVVTDTGAASAAAERKAASRGGPGGSLRRIL